MVRTLAICALAGALALQGIPTIAIAVTSEELQAKADEAREELEALGKEVQAAGEQLHETQYALETTKQQIKETKAEIEESKVELAEAQDMLARRVASNYKTGTAGLLSIILDAASFEELESSLYYTQKMYQSDTEAIQAVKDIRSKLEGQQAKLEEQQEEQKKLIEDQKAQVAQLKEQEEAQSKYVKKLDAEVAAKIEEERQAELERQRKEAEEAALRAAAAAAEEAGNAGGYYSGGSSGSGGGLSSAQRNTIIAAAYSQIGVPYVFGACSPGSAFDCSGFTMYCYAQAGISLPHSAAAQSGCATGISYAQMQPGDLIFWIGTGSAALSGNHVAIYLGDGMIIHSSFGGVQTQAIYGGITKFGTIL